MLSNEEEKILQNSSKKVDRTIYTDQQDFIIERSKFLTENKLIVTRKHTRFISFPPHKHDYIELNYVYHGKLSQTIGTQRITLKKGELLFLNQYIEHSLEECREEDIIINFIIDPLFFDYMFKEFEMNGAEQSIVNFLIHSLFGEERRGSYLYFKVSEVSAVQEIIEKMIVEMMNPHILSETAVKFYMGLLITELMKQSYMIDSSLEGTFDHQIMLEVLNYIEQDYSNAALEVLANQLNLQGYSLSKMIKQQIGKNFKELLQQKRIDEAKKQLRYSRLSIEEIAKDVGYQNVSYFYRLFKSIVGCTPSYYRKQQIELQDRTK